MEENKNKLYRWLALSFCAIFFFYTFFHFITRPSSLVLQMDGDAVKNYFTFLYHSLYEKGVWFGGMNYPYGDNIVFADGQPLLSIPLSYLNTVFHFSVEQLLAIMHLIIVLGYVLAIVYVYKILDYFKVVEPMAIVFATLIVLLSPQIFRLAGHFALSYACIIPMIFYWYIKYHDTNRVKYCIYIFIIGCMAVFLHPYFLAVLLLWIAFYSLGYILFIKKSLGGKIRHLVPLLVSFVLVFASFKLYLVATDPNKDRPTFPWGFLDACSSLNQVLTSTFSPIWRLFKDKPFYSTLNSGGEGNGYWGMVVIIVATILIIMGLRNLVRRKPDAIISESSFSFIWLFIAFGTLLMSMGYPFILKNMGWLLGHLSVLKQFRSLGRFSWICYYIIAIYAVIGIDRGYKWLKGRNKIAIGYGMVGLCIVIWSTEAYGYSLYLKEKTSAALQNYRTFFSKDEKGWNSFLTEKNLKSNDFQAMLLLPYFHVGTEKLWVSDEHMDWALTFGLKASMQTRLPLVNVMMSRSSWSQALKQVRLVAGPYSDKPLLREGNNKPLLVLQPVGQSELDNDTKYLLRSSDYLGDHLGFHVFACYPSRIVANDRLAADGVCAISLAIAVQDTCVGSKENCFVFHLDSGSYTHPIFGGAAMKAKAEFDSTFLQLSLKPVTDSTEFEFSVWVLVNEIDYSSPYFELKLLNNNDQELSTITVKSTNSVDNLNMWFRVSKYFKIPPGCAKIKGRILDWGYYAMDEIQIRPSTTMVISKDSKGNIMVNNHFYDHKCVK